MSPAVRTAAAVETDPHLIASANPSGQLRTLSTGGPLDPNNAFYDTRFTLNLTAQEKADLVAFLGAL